MSVATTYSPEQVSNIIRDYHWMVKEISRINNILKDTEFTGTAQYGLEATLPKGNKVHHDKMDFEVDRRIKKSRRVEKMERKIRFIQERFDRLKDEREKVILDCLLDGMNLTDISEHLGMSRKHIHKIKDNIAEQLAQ
jgi:DNA-directed RNA polymerase specialized sigma subunit